MRTAHLCEFSTLLGGERSLLTFLQAAAGVGVDPVVVAPAEGRLAQAVHSGGWKHLPWPSDPKSSVGAVAKPLADAGIDVIHANSLSLLDAASELRQALGRPAVLHVRDVYGLSKARRVRLASLDAVVAVSAPVARWLKSIGAPRDRLHIVSNGMEVRSVGEGGRLATRSELGLPEGRRLVATIGQISLRKGQDVFLRAAQRVAVGAPEVDFLVIGERYSVKGESQAYEEELRRLSSQPPLAGRVHWLGYREDVRDILQHVDLVVAASRQEPLSRALLESMAEGVAAVASDVGGNREILDGGRLGILVPVDDAVAAAAGISAILNDEDLRRRANIEGPAHVRRRYDPAAHAQAVAAVYRKVLARRGGSGES
jgi:glycosyltransferase involved in cell wall biosynthesis